MTHARNMFMIQILPAFEKFKILNAKNEYEDEHLFRSSMIHSFLNSQTRFPGNNHKIYFYFHDLSNFIYTILHYSKNYYFICINGNYLITRHKIFQCSYPQ